MSYRFRAAKTFWRSWSKLSREQQQIARQAFPIFKQNPFDPRLRAHKIHRLSAHYGRTIYAVDIAGDLRAAFYVEGETIWSVSVSAYATFTRAELYSAFRTPRSSPGWAKVSAKSACGNGGEWFKDGTLETC